MTSNSRSILVDLNLSEIDIIKFGHVNEESVYEMIYPPAHELVNESTIVDNIPVSISYKQQTYPEDICPNLVDVYQQYFNSVSFSYDTLSQHYIFLESVCWWCCHSLDTGVIPIAMPYNYNEYTKKFKVKGIFCSFNCCLAYNQSRKNYSRQSDCSVLLHFLYKKMTKDYKRSYNFHPAPKREVLMMFGGLLSIHEFRKTFSCITECNILEYPLIHDQPTMIQAKKKNLYKKSDIRRRNKTTTDGDDAPKKKKVLDML